ncbi:hypothetical protein [Paraburkholderia tropica]|uniref:hypothetical protein n=1 Tax=Paraburkholderia tropica TaxID=92647 RepID=UPI002ABDC487|nr:hypothetical protein [Paraburkholderia tropica]
MHANQSVMLTNLARPAVSKLPVKRCAQSVFTEMNAARIVHLYGEAGTEVKA